MHRVVAVEMSAAEDGRNGSIHCMEYERGLKPVGRMVRYDPSGGTFERKEVLHYVFGI